MEKERRNEIAYAMEKIHARRGFSFRDIDEVNRQAGNMVNDSEMKAINVTIDELLVYMEQLLRDLFEGRMKVNFLR